MRKIIFIFLFAILAFPAISRPLVYHVSMQGSDTNPGSCSSPFKTLGKACEVLTQGDTCIVHAGIYRECIRPKNNGTQNNPVVFMAAKDEVVTISGMEPVNNWIEDKNHIYKAKVPWNLEGSNMVLINNRLGFEARFPNKTNADPFDPEGGEIIAEGISTRESEEHENPYRFLTNSIPQEWAGLDMKDAKLWVLAQHKWSAWISPVLRYDGQSKALYFIPFKVNNNWVSSNHNPNFINEGYGKSIYYMFGSKIFLDDQNEWYYDKLTNELFIILPQGRKPIVGEVEFRKLKTVVDFRDKKFCEISGFGIIGASINMSNSENCKISSCRIQYFWHTIPEQSIFASAKNSGILMGGRNNTIQNSEISFSAGSAISLSGFNNIIVNNLIHDLNYIGSSSYGALNTEGIGHQIIYNTIYSTGRDCIRLNNGGGHIIAWNNIYDPGLICEDLGVIYSGGTDYENLQIHHNYIHNNNKRKKSVLGVYFDNFTTNGIVYNNVIWGIDESIRLNRPGNYHMIYNNIVLEINNAYGIWNGPETQFGLILVNNICLKAIKSNPEVCLKNNIEGIFPFDTIGLLPTETYRKMNGQAGVPDYTGAFDPSQSPGYGPVGCDFKRETILMVSTELPFLRNYVRNGSFEWQTNRGVRPDKLTIDQWETFGNVELFYAPGFNIPGPDTRNSIYGNSLLFKSDSAGISQYVEDIRQGQEYKIGVYARQDENCELIVNVYTGRKNISVSSGDFSVKDGWKLLILSFTADENDMAVKLSFSKTGKGNTYIDNIGMIPVIQKKL